ncbi:MAG: tRNA (cytidine(34)-2'-O)-methyltransferase [Deltaproteobacteria bacterium]|jgi:tRNA (cytidine/uridine-2'-O-)-methyltransferase|nr:tRNA (cytidine(34)-2'-O)-methyltransferase [Deltaproteobacteria bacterium]
MDIILFEPEIPPNTGNIARLAAGLSMPLHLIEPIGFSLSDKYLKRAGLDYWPYVDLHVWEDFASFKEAWRGGRLIGTSAKEGKNFTLYEPKADDGIIFGPESKGLGKEFLEKLDLVLHIPTRREVRSLNLATTVGFFMGVALCRL